MSKRAPPKPRRLSYNDPTLRAFRRTMLAAFAFALVGLAIAGALTLLLARSSDVPGRVFGSLLVVIGYAGIILASVQAALRGIGPRWFCWVVTAVALSSAGLLITDIWLALPFRTWPAIPTAFFLAGGTIAAWPNSVLHHRARWKAFVVFALVVASVAAVASMLDTWLFNPPGSAGWTVRAKALISLWVVAGAVFQTGLLGMLRPRSVHWLPLSGAICLGWLLAALLISLTWAEKASDPFWTRVLGVVAILAACASLLSAVMSLASMSRSRNTGAGAPLIPDLQLVCPVCTTAQRIMVGDDRCSLCNCRFEIKVTPENCPGCGYALADLPERKCPECGHAF